MSSGNPTARQDLENLNLPEELQYPSLGPPVVTIDTDELDIFQVYPQEIDLAYTPLRCSREKYPELPDAQAFFNRKRQEAVDSGRPWRGEGAVFRTARYWCKRILP